MIGALLGAVLPALVTGIFGRAQRREDHRTNRTEAIRASDQSFEHNRTLMHEQNALNRSNADRDYHRNRTDFLADRAHNEAREDAFNAKNHVLKLRQDALDAGFNPLTALGLSGGVQAPMAPTSSYGGATATAGVSGQSVATFAAPPLSSSNFIGNALGAGLETLFNKDKIVADLEAEAIRLDMAKQDFEAIKKSNEEAGARQSFGYSIPTITQAAVMDGGVTFARRPKSRPTATDRLRAPIFLPEGTQKQVPVGPLRRLDILPWETVSAGEYSELVGELRGEGESALLMDKIGQNMGIPVFGGNSKNDTRSIPPKPKGGHALRNWKKKYGHLE